MGRRRRRRRVCFGGVCVDYVCGSGYDVGCYCVLWVIVVDFCWIDYVCRYRGRRIRARRVCVDVYFGWEYFCCCKIDV